MFREGEIIVHGGEGACRVESVCDLNLTGSAKAYYVLQPLVREGRIYVPVDGKVFLRHVISREEALRLIDEIPSIHVEPYCSGNLRKMDTLFRSLLDTHECIDLIRLLMIIYEKKRVYQESGRKIGSIDQKNMQRAEKLLFSEFSAALGISMEEVAELFRQRLENDPAA